MKHTATMLLLALTIGQVLMCDQTRDGRPLQPTGASELTTGNPRYSEAILNHRLPEELLAEKEAALAAADSTFRRFLVLPRAAKAALEAGRNDKAEEYASKALAIAAQYDHRRVLENGHPVSNAGEETFYSHVVLGRLALLRGEINAAKDHLLLAGKTAGSPILDVAGPNMSLAMELLKISEQDTVLKFLAECKDFWKKEDGRLDRWSAEIRRGGIPDFGANLFF